MPTVGMIIQPTLADVSKSYSNGIICKSKDYSSESGLQAPGPWGGGGEVVQEHSSTTWPWGIWGVSCGGKNALQPAGNIAKCTRPKVQVGASILVL